MVTYDGQTLLASVSYPGQVALPVVAGASLQAQSQGTDLQLSWVNPTGDANWADGSRTYVVLFDGSGQDRGFLFRLLAQAGRSKGAQMARAGRSEREKTPASCWR